MLKDEDFKTDLTAIVEEIGTKNQLYNYYYIKLNHKLWTEDIVKLVFTANDLEGTGFSESEISDIFDISIWKKVSFNIETITFFDGLSCLNVKWNLSELTKDPDLMELSADKIVTFGASSYRSIGDGPQYAIDNSIWISVVNWTIMKNNKKIEKIKDSQILTEYKNRLIGFSEAPTVNMGSSGSGIRDKVKSFQESLLKKYSGKLVRYPNNNLITSLWESTQNT